MKKWKVPFVILTFLGIEINITLDFSRMPMGKLVELQKMISIFFFFAKERQPCMNFKYCWATWIVFAGLWCLGGIVSAYMWLGQSAGPSCSHIWLAHYAVEAIGSTPPQGDALSEAAVLAGHSPGKNDLPNTSAVELTNMIVKDLKCIYQIFPNTWVSGEVGPLKQVCHGASKAKTMDILRQKINWTMYKECSGIGGVL